MKRQKICLYTFEFPGIIANGGIGTAFRALAEELVEAGHDVTVLTPSAYTENLPVSWWIDHWRERGIKVVSLFVEGTAKLHAYLAYQWLKQRDFDVIHYHDWRGAGYWLTVAKRCGLAFRDTTLVCQAHGQTFWHLEHSGIFLSAPAEVETDWLEQRSVEGADILYSPSAYFIDYMAARGWAVPGRRFVTPNLLPKSFPEGQEGDGARKPVEEIVFFGRLESRKGLELFCDAMTRLLARGAGPSRVVFLGKIGEVAGGSALAYITEATAGWTVPWMVRNDLDTDGAKAFLAHGRRLAVIASSIENSPYTVLECIASGQPFLAADVGGVRELVHADDQPAVVFARTPAALEAAMADALAQGGLCARPAVTLAENRRRWREWHATLGGPGAPAVVDATPLVSVCMSSFNRPELLAQAIRSIEAQSWTRLEMVLVDDASPSEAAKRHFDALAPVFAARGWTLLRNETEMWTGRARNHAVAHARGDHVLLMDDDNAAFPHEVETLMRAAQASGADIITCQQQPFTGPGEPPRHVARYPMGWMPVGPCLSLALFENCLGDLNMLVRREVWNTLGGFTEDRVGCEDWEFLLRAGLEGYHLECLPELLFCYRATADNLARRYSSKVLYDSFTRAVRPARAKMPPALLMAMRLASESRFAASRQQGEGYWARHGQAAPGIRAIAETGPGGTEGLVAAARHVLARGDEATGLLLLRQALTILPSAAHVAIELIGREEDAAPPAPPWLEQVAAGLREEELSRAGLALGRLMARGDQASAQVLAGALARRFPDSEQGRFLLAMTNG